MRILLIEEIENCLKAKRELIGGLSTEMIKAIINAFLLGVEDHIKTENDQDNINAAWEVKQHFMRKYRFY